VGALARWRFFCGKGDSYSHSYSHSHSGAAVLRVGSVRVGWRDTP